MLRFRGAATVGALEERLTVWRGVCLRGTARALAEAAQPGVLSLSYLAGGEWRHTGS